MLRSCITCGVLVESASGCALHAKRPRSTPGRTGAGQAAFRDAVPAAAEYRCQAVENGVRCRLTDLALLDAHHLKRLRDGGTNDTSNGVCVGRHHHRLVEPSLRSVTDPHSRETIAQLRGMSEAT
jgi:predicted restriction endonuclease